MCKARVIGRIVNLKVSIFLIISIKTLYFYKFLQYRSKNLCFEL